MSCSEFCVRVTPMVKELQDECRNMTLDEFLKLRQEVMGSVVVEKELCKRFMTEVFDIIEENIFRKNGEVA
mgnify:CR=1 FL=1